MAQKNNGPVIGMAIFALLSVSFAVFWYMTWSDNQLVYKSLGDATKKEQDLNGTVRDQLAEIQHLKGLIDVGENVETGIGDPDQDTVDGRTQQILKDLAGDGTAALPALIPALRKESAENNKNSFTATNRMQQLVLKRRENDQLTINKDGEIDTQKAAVAKAEAKLIQQEAILNE